MKDAWQGGGWRLYVLAGAACALAAVVSLYLSPIVEPTPMALFLVAVIASAWLGGPGPALAAGLMSALLLNAFFLTKATDQGTLSLASALPLAVFLLTGAAVGVLVMARRRADTARAAAAAAEQAALASARAAEHRTAFLAEVGTLLASSLNFEAALDSLARMAVSWQLADWCLVDVYDADGSLRRIAAVHGDASRQALVTELQQRYARLQPRAPHTLWKVLGPEKPWIDPVVDEKRLEAEARDPEHFRLLRDIGFKSEMVVPLTARGRTLGAITLVRGEPGKPYGPDDLALAQELAQRAGLAADNARLYAEAQRLNAELEQRVQERTAQLLQTIAVHEQTLRTLRENERRLAEAQQIAHLGSWHQDLGSVTVTWSDELYRLHGLEPQPGALDADSHMALVHPDDRERVASLLAAARQSGLPFDFDFRIVRPDGQVRSLHARGTITRDEAGKATAIEGTAHDITEREQLAQALLQSHAELSRLSAHMQTAREEERARIAREIHDELGGSLTGVKMDLARLRRAGQAGSAAWLSQLDTVATALDDTVQTVRRIATELRPAILDDFGLVAALEWQLKEFQSRSGIECDMTAALEDVELDRDSSTAVFRMFQETLTNVARHAQATRVHVRLYRQPGYLVLQVTDNGRGFNHAELAPGKAFGLVGMRERARLLGGRVEMQGGPGQGTTIIVQVPLAEASQPAAAGTD